MSVLGNWKVLLMITELRMLQGHLAWLCGGTHLCPDAMLLEESEKSSVCLQSRRKVLAVGCEVGSCWHRGGV